MGSTLAPELLSRPTNELPYLKFHNFKAWECLIHEFHGDNQRECN